MKHFDAASQLRRTLFDATTLEAMSQQAAEIAAREGRHADSVFHRRVMLKAATQARAARKLLSIIAPVVQRETIEAPKPRREVKTLPERLENWARYLRGGRTYETTITGIICESMRRWHMGDESGALTQSDIDDLDGELVHRCMLKLNGFQRDLLDKLYRWRLPPEVICRKMGIKPRPTSVFDLRRRNAEEELQKHLDAIVVR